MQKLFSHFKEKHQEFLLLADQSKKGYKCIYCKYKAFFVI